MAVNYQIAIDCRNPDLLAHFWIEALGYVPAPAPDGFATWDDYWRSIGVPEAELGLGVDIIVDPAGAGPRIQFHVVPEVKSIKNRFHLDVRASGGPTVPLEVRKERIEAAATRLVEAGATRLRTVYQEGMDHYAVALLDPEGNEFDIN